MPIEACRVADTRPAFNVGPRNTPLGAEETHTIDAHGDNGNCVGIPTSATGLVLNVTALDATSATFLAVWASGATRPTVSSLNPAPGQPPTPNAVTTQLSTSGAFDIFNKAGTVDVIVDINGFYTDHEHSGGTGTPGPAGPAGPAGPTATTVPTVRICSTAPSWSTAAAATPRMAWH